MMPGLYRAISCPILQQHLQQGQVSNGHLLHGDHHESVEELEVQLRLTASWNVERCVGVLRCQINEHSTIPNVVKHSLSEWIQFARRTSFRLAEEAVSLQHNQELFDYLIGNTLWSLMKVKQEVELLSEEGVNVEQIQDLIARMLDQIDILSRTADSHSHDQ